MAWDTIFLLGIAALATVLNPDARAWAHRAGVAWRFRRNGYSWRSAWHLAEGR